MKFELTQKSELRRVHRVVPDSKAAQHQSFEYLYDQGWFIPIKLPPTAKESNARRAWMNTRVDE